MTTADTNRTADNSAEAAEPQTIVLARATLTELEPTGGRVLRDCNYAPEFELGWAAEALAWLRRGTTEDVKKAEEHAAREGYRVFTFPTSERDPLGRAREAVLKDARAAAR